MWQHLLSALSFGIIGSYVLWVLATRVLLSSISFAYSLTQKLFLQSVVATLCFFYWLYCPAKYLLPYGLFVGASCLVFYTDALVMLIARMTSLYLVPVAWFFAYHNLLDIAFLESIGGALLGISIFLIVQWLSHLYYKQAGLGVGDIDYIALAGAYTGFLGVWLTIMLGSLLASLWILNMLLIQKLTRSIPLPFGSFLAAAGILILFFKNELAFFLM